MALRDPKLAALQARVYGRQPDATAVAELRVLLGAGTGGPDTPEGPRRSRPLRAGPSMTRRAGSVAVVLLVVAATAAGAWGIGAVAPTIQTGALRASPQTVASPRGTGTGAPTSGTFFVDASTGRVLDRCRTVTSGPGTDPSEAESVCRAVQYRRMLQERPGR